MIDNKRMFSAAIILLSAVIIFNFPFPHNYPLGEGLITIFNIPVTLESGIHLPGIIVLIMLLGSFFLLAKSLYRYKGRAILAAILTVCLMPAFLADLYQKTAASGIYAVKYEKESSSCMLERREKEFLHASCTIPLENYSGKETDFSLSFVDYADSDVRFASLLNEEGPYIIQLKPNEKRQIEIEAEIEQN